MNKIDIVLGDWSDDGHGKSDKITILVNKTPQEMKLAYKASCKALGISFNHNDDFTEVKPLEDFSEQYNAENARQVCAEYGETQINQWVLDILKENCSQFIDKEVIEEIETNDTYLNQVDFLALLMGFVSYSLPEFKWEYPEAGDVIPVFNGYRDDELNVQLGYGLYD